MDEEQFLHSLPDLTGKIALVTGGAGSIGLETTIYLARKGATVFVASRNREKSEQGIVAAKQRLQDNDAPIKFHHLDLASIKSAKESAQAFKNLESRLDILVCNAAISLSSLQELSADGYERTFATNHLGHFVFVMELLGMLEEGAKQHGDARVVMVSSLGYRMAQKLDYDALKTRVDGDGTRLRDLKGAFVRYFNSKLANIYFAAELDRRLGEKNIHNIYVTGCHPGSVASSSLGAGEQIPISQTTQNLLKGLLNRFSNTIPDSAKTQVYLAASREIVERDVHGEYWIPSWSWTLKYKGCHKEELTALGRNEEEQKKLWLFSEKAVAEALSSG